MERRSAARQRHGHHAAARAQVPGAEQELEQAETHADRGQREAQVPAVVLADRADHQRRGEGADVDAHVEDGESAVPARIAGPVVEVPDHRGDVRLEQAGAERDQGQAREEGALAGQRQRQVAGHDDQRRDGDGLARPPHPVAEPAARHGEQVDHRHVDGVDRGGGGRGHRQAAALRTLAGGRAARDQVQRQQRAHAVEAEALPHLGHEQSGQSARVAEEGAAGVAGVFPRAGVLRRQAGRHGEVPLGWGTSRFPGTGV